MFEGAFVDVVHVVVLVLEALGVLAMVLGFGVAIVYAARGLMRGKGARNAFQTLRTMIGASILLGLEVLVAADLIRTILTPSLEEAATLGLIVVIRTVLSISIQIEIEGVLPWRRALMTSGGQVLTEEVAKQHARD